MKENQKKAFDFAADTTKQLITIATAIITLTVAFSKDIIGGAEKSDRTFLIWTWIAFIASIICGILTLMTLTGTLQPKRKKVHSDMEKNETSIKTIEVDPSEEIDINKGNIRMFSILQSSIFIIAICMTGYFGCKSVKSLGSDNPNENHYQIIRRSTLNNDSSKVYIDTLYLNKK